MKKILIIIVGLLIGLFVWNKSEGLTNFNLSSWFQNEDKVNNSVIGGVGSPSTDLTFKTINGESILGYGNLNISSDLIIDVEELPTSSWKGTTIPNTGYVEKLYVNTQLSIEEVVALIKDLPFTYYTEDNDVIPEYYVYRTSGGDNNMCVLFSNGVYYIVDDSISFSIDKNKVLFCSSSDDPDILPGWGMLEQRIQNGDYTNPIEVNGEVIPFFTTTITSGEVHMGTQNDLISSLFSTTPFEYVEAKIDDKSIYRVSGSLDYKGIQILNGEKKELSNENLIINFVNELPEIGVDFFDMETSKFTLYYNTSDMILYAYAGPIGSMITGNPEGTWIDVTTVDIMPTSVIYSDSEIGNEEGRVYILITGNTSYFIYDESWVELVDSRNINKYLSKEKHLYEHFITLSSPDYIDVFEIHFSYLDSKINDWSDFNNILPDLVENKINFVAPAFGYYKEGFTSDGAKKQIVSIRVSHFNEGTKVYLDNADGESVVFSDQDAYSYTYTHGSYRQIF